MLGEKALANDDSYEAGVFFRLIEVNYLNNV